MSLIAKFDKPNGIFHFSLVIFKKDKIWRKTIMEIEILV
ncbi:MAG: hypothetical protein ACI85O_003725, partial [Saprospiraceae bacterium]